MSAQPEGLYMRYLNKLARQRPHNDNDEQVERAYWDKKRADELEKFERMNPKDGEA